MIDRALFAVTIGGLVLGALVSFFTAFVAPLGISFDGHDPAVVYREVLFAYSLGTYYLFGIWALSRRKAWAPAAAGLPYLGWALFFVVDMATKGPRTVGLVLFALNAAVCALLAWRRQRVLPGPKP